jgi:hypothetical protein
MTVITPEMSLDEIRALIDECDAARAAQRAREREAMTPEQRAAADRRPDVMYLELCARFGLEP